MTTPIRSQDEIDAREAQWWYLNPGDEGYGTPLHEYLGFTEQEWRERLLRRAWTPKRWQVLVP